MDISKDISLSSIMEHQRIIIPVICLVLSLIMGNNIYKGSQQDVDVVKQKIEQEKKINQLIRSISLQEDRFFRYQDKFYSENAAGISGEISRGAARSSVRILSLNPLERVEDGVVRIFPFELKVRGGYHNIGHFVSRIESLGPSLSITKFKLSGQDRLNGNNSLDAGIDAGILVKAVFAAGERRPRGGARHNAPGRKFGGLSAWQRAAEGLEGDGQ